MSPHLAELLPHDFSLKASVHPLFEDRRLIPDRLNPIEESDGKKPSQTLRFMVAGGPIVVRPVQIYKALCR